MLPQCKPDWAWTRFPQVTLLVRLSACCCFTPPCADLLFAEAGSLDRCPASIAAAVTLSALRDSVAETGAGNRSLYAFRPARTVASSALPEADQKLLNLPPPDAHLICLVPGIPLGSPNPPVCTF